MISIVTIYYYYNLLRLLHILFSYFSRIEYQNQNQLLTKLFLYEIESSSIYLNVRLIDAAYFLTL